MTAYASALCGVLCALVLAMGGLFLVPARVASSVTPPAPFSGLTEPQPSASMGQAAEARVEGAPYLLQGDVGTNVRAALGANGGALMGFVIQPGATWSFGHSIAPISALGALPVVCGPAGCNAGGGWCDLSALYVKVADQLGLQSTFPAHIGVADTRFPGILLDEQGNGGDLLVTNPTERPVTFQAQIEGDTLLIEGGFV